MVFGCTLVGAYALRCNIVHHIVRLSHIHLCKDTNPRLSKGNEETLFYWLDFASQHCIHQANISKE